MNVTAENTGPDVVEGTLLLALEEAPGNSAAWMHAWSASPEAVSVAPGARLERTSALDRDAYRENGSFRLVATLRGAEATQRLEIASGYEVRLEVPGQTTSGEKYEMLLEVTNVLASSIEGLQVTVTLPSTDPAVLEETVEYTVPALGAGETFRKALPLVAGPEGLSSVYASLGSPLGGVERQHALVAVVGEGRIIASLDAPQEVAAGEPFAVTLSVSNPGGTPVRDVTLELILPTGWSAREGSAATVPELGPGKQETITRTLVCEAPGSGALLLRAKDAGGHGSEGVAFVRATDAGTAGSVRLGRWLNGLRSHLALTLGLVCVGGVLVLLLALAIVLTMRRRRK